MFLEVSVSLQCLECGSLKNFDSQKHLALACPERHALATQLEVFGELSFCSKTLFQLLNLVLLDAKECVASASLGIYGLCLVLHNLLLGSHKLRHGL